MGELMNEIEGVKMMDLDDEKLQELYAWVDEIPLSRPKRNMTRDFSDGGEFHVGFQPKITSRTNINTYVIGPSIIVFILVIICFIQNMTNITKFTAFPWL